MEELFRKKSYRKHIEPRVRVSRKTLERHRKYIIAMYYFCKQLYIYSGLHKREKHDE